MPLGALETITAANLSYFVALGNAAGFLNTENRPFIDSFTLAPDQTSFGANSPKVLADIAHFNLTNLNQTTLEEFVKYQSISEVIYSTALENGTALMTEAGVPLLVTAQDGDIWVNTAKVTWRDLLVANGVAHVIDE